MAIQIQLRRATAAEWASANPLLANGEVAISTDVKNFKVGDGVTNWSSLSYYITSSSSNVTSTSVITDHSLVRGDGGVRGVQDSGVIIDDSNNITGIVDLTATGDIAANNLSGTNTGDRTQITEILTLDATDISNKYKDLANEPLDNTAVGLFPVGGVRQKYGTDFTVITDGSDILRVNWNGLALDGILANGDNIIAEYIY